MNATLTDERIETMRSTVMHAVDSDITRRGTRARRSAGLLAAGILVLGTGTLGVGLLDTNSDRADDTAASGGAQGVRPPSEVTEQLSMGAADAKGAAHEQQLDAPREIIVTGSISVRVGDPRESAQQVSTYVDSIGGRVDSRSESADDDHESAHLQVRVPSTKVTETIAELKTVGTVTNVSLDNQDVTTQAQDLDARIEALKISVRRLEKIMAEASSSGELIKAESALTQRQEQLESLTTQRASVTDQVTLSTLSIELSQRPRADSVPPGGFKGGVVDGWNALVRTLNTIVELVGVILPWAAIAAVLYGVYRLVARRREWS